MMKELIDQRTAEVHAAKDQDAQDGLSDDMLTRMIEASAAEEQKLSKQELIDIVSCQPNSFLCWTNEVSRPCK